MKINISLPFDQTEKPDEFLTPDAIVEVAQHAERLGYDGGNVTDHPCPPGRWLDSGGHHAHDPFVLLSFVAAATTTLRLQTGILVLPYRTPFLPARPAAKLGLYSKGRVTTSPRARSHTSETQVLEVGFERRH